MRLWQALRNQQVLVICVAVIDIALLYAIYAVLSSDVGFEGLLKLPGVKGSGITFLVALGIGALVANLGALVVIYNEYKSHP